MKEFEWWAAGLSDRGVGVTEPWLDFTQDNKQLLFMTCIQVTRLGFLLLREALITSLWPIKSDLSGTKFARYFCERHKMDPGRVLI